MGSYCYILSCQAIKTNATRGPNRVMHIGSGEPPGMLDQRPGSLPRIARGDRQVVKSCLPTLIIRWRSDDLVRHHD
jgi:hypothetical protein